MCTHIYVFQLTREAADKDQLLKQLENPRQQLETARTDSKKKGEALAVLGKSGLVQEQLQETARTDSKKKRDALAVLGKYGLVQEQLQETARTN